MIFTKPIETEAARSLYLTLKIHHVTRHPTRNGSSKGKEVIAVLVVLGIALTLAAFHR